MNSIAAFPIVGAVKPSVLDEAEHLRHLLEKQPCCLLRVGLDGQVLAANDAAQEELGARDLGEVLGRPFTNWIVAGDHEVWNEFADEVRTSGSDEEECDLISLDRAQHPVLLTGVLLADHPDGIASVLLVVRDISRTRRLEQALQDHAGARRALADLRQRFERALAEQQDVRRAIEQRDADIQRLIAERSTLQEQLNVLQWRLDGAAAEQVRLEELLEEQARQRKTLVDMHNAGMAEAERALAAAATETEQALKAFADQRVELESLNENTRSLEPLASAGRLAFDVANEFLCTTAAINACARSMLLRCPETSADRQPIETLLSEANRAISLARQFVVQAPDPVENSAPRDAVPDAVDSSATPEGSDDAVTE